VRPEEKKTAGCALVERLITEPPLILGSGSPRRARILRELGIEPIVDPPGIPEDAMDGEGPEEHVARLAREKALSVSRRHATGTVVAADTIVLLEGRILGKPAGPPDAVRLLRMLRGRRHDVFTGVSVARCSDGTVEAGVERTRVAMRDLTDEEIGLYVEGGEPLDKAGAYGIQDCGAAVVSAVDGCFYNVVGLPVVLLCELLGRLSTEPR